MLVELGDTGEVKPFTQISLVLASAFPEPELSNVVACSKLYPHVEELLSPSNMAAAKEVVSRSLRLNLLLRSMIYLRLHGRANEALKVAGRVYEEKKDLLEGACSHVVFSGAQVLFLGTPALYKSRSELAYLYRTSPMAKRLHNQDTM